MLLCAFMGTIQMQMPSEAKNTSFSATGVTGKYKLPEGVIRTKHSSPAEAGITFNH